MEDKIVRAISGDGMVQAAAIYSRNLTERARQIHKTLPVATAALGRTLAAASMMGNALKGQGASLTLQIKGGGRSRGECPRLRDEPPGGPASAAGRQAGRGRRRGP